MAREHKESRGEGGRWSTLFGPPDPEIARLRLRGILESREQWATHTPAVFDVLSARIAERTGFETVVLSGYGVSAAQLGLPDLGFLSLSTVTGVVRVICARTALSVIVDCDTGFGNALNAMHTAESVISAGVAGFFLEDQVNPKRSGHMGGKAVVPVEEQVGKLRAVDRVRREVAPTTCLIARSDARGVRGSSIDDVIERGLRYADAGADVFFPEGLLSVDDLARCAEKVPVPMMYNMNGKSPVFGLDQLAEMNVAFAVAGEAMRPALAAISAYFDGLRDHSVEGLANVPDFDLNHFLGFAEASMWETQFLP